MAGKILLILFYFLFPVFVIYLGSRYSVVQKIGSIAICYLAGLLIGNLEVIPYDSANLQNTITSITIPLALPLLLFSEDIRKWLKMARKTFISMILGLVSVIIMVVVGHFIFRDNIPEAWKVSGMLIGVYSGGTPNLAAIQEMLGVDEEIYLLTHTSDLVIGAVLLLFLLTLGQRFFLLFLKPYKENNNRDEQSRIDEMAREFESYDNFFHPSIFRPLLKAFGLALVIVAIGGGLSFLFSENFQSVAAILFITTLGILASLVPSVNRIKKTFPLGMYFILVFSVVVASMADLGHMFGRDQSDMLLSLFLYVLLAVVGSLLLHAIFSKIFGMDADHFIITSVALSMSPPFVPVVAAALKNKTLVLSGLILGILGYAIGNYLGVLMAYTLK